MNVLNTYQRVITYFRNKPEASIREAARKLDLSKSATHRHQQAQKRRNLYPESHFWDSEEGQNWLCRLLVAVAFIFIIQRGIGAETVSSFLQLLRLDSHLGTSPGAIQAIVHNIESKIAEYKNHCKDQIQQSATNADVTIGVDETFFSQMILVCMDLRSGFIFSEDFSEKRDYETWTQFTHSHEKEWHVNVRLVISDRAGALIKLAEKGWKCSHIPDLFHATHDIVKAIGGGLQQKCHAARQQLSKAHASLKKLENTVDKLPSYQQEETFLEQEKMNLISAEKTQESCKKAQEKYQKLLTGVSLELHPFTIDESIRQSSKVIEEKLQLTYNDLREIQHNFQLKDSQKHLESFAHQIQTLPLSVDLWWNDVENALSEYKVSSQHYEFIINQWLPYFYWKHQQQKTKAHDLKRIYQQLETKAQSVILNHPYYQSFDKKSLQEWQQWAESIVNAFQRASSSVEGRNGFLSQVYHTRRGLSQQRLHSLTTIHNFYIKRHDGSTAAKRLYKNIEFPDMFEFILGAVPQLPVARRRKNKTSPSALAITACPA